MPAYIRAFVPGGTFFFTLVSYRRRPILTTASARVALRSAIQEVRSKRFFVIQAIVLLPDHLHCIWTLPDNDADFSTRVRLMKSRTTHLYLEAGGTEAAQSVSRLSKGERGVWHRRFWERTVRDEDEFFALCDYIHYNPVKHGHATCPHAWPYSSFHKFAKARIYDFRWQCVCDDPRNKPPDFTHLTDITGE